MSAVHTYMSRAKVICKSDVSEIVVKKITQLQFSTQERLDFRHFDKKVI